MRIRRLTVPIAIIAALTILVGVTAGLIWARDQASRTPRTEVMVSPAETPLKVGTPSNPRQQEALYAGRSGREVSGQGRSGTSEDNARTLWDSLEPPSVVEKNAGNGALANGTNDGIIGKQAQYGQDAGPVIQSGPGGGPVGLPGASADGDEDKNKEMDQSQDQASPFPEKTELQYPNLGSHLDGLVVQVEEEETTSEDAASDTPVHSGESVAVTILLTGGVDEVVAFLEENGGDPRNVGEDYIEAYVPLTLLGQLSERHGVLRVRAIVPPEPGRLAGHRPGRLESALDRKHGIGGAGGQGMTGGRGMGQGCGIVYAYQCN